MPLQQINLPVSRVVTPVLSRLADDPERYRSAYTRVVQQILLVTVPGVVCLLVNADTAIPALLGDQWTATVPIFMWLGFSALHQPMSVTTGWLFVSQRRTDELAVWGFIAAVTCICAFVIGLKWGAVGVAAAYTISDIFFRLPFVYWFVGRKGPVSTSTLVSIAWPNAVANGIAACILLQFPRELGFPPLVDLLGQVILTYILCWTLLALFPSGRATILEAVKIALALRRPSK